MLMTNLKNAGFSCHTARLTATTVALLCCGFVAHAAEPPNNRGVVMLETSGSAGASIRIAEDLASIVDDGATRRVLPVVGRSALQNLQDLAMLRGVDMAILQADMVDTVRQQRSLGGIESGFTYIAKLYNEEFHLLARPEIKTFADLANQTVNVDIRSAGTGVTAARLFDLLKIRVVTTNDSQEVAIEKLRNGKVAALAFVAAKPAPLFAALRRDEGLHFLAVPLDPLVVRDYIPTSLTAADYPGLIAGDQAVDTVAVGSILAVAPLKPGVERYKNVSTFVDVFFTEFRALLGPGFHPKWREVNLTTELPGWRRFPPAQQWLDRNVSVARQNPQDFKALFSRFLDVRQQASGATPMSEQQKQGLFDEFSRWQTGQPR